MVAMTLPEPTRAEMTQTQPAILATGDGDRQHEDLWPMGRVIAFTGLSRSTINRHIAAGTIPLRRVGGRVLFVPSEIRHWVDTQPPAPVAQRPAAEDVA
jgi:predicted DNA-binding transcriptional regulator AlpA